MLPRAGGPLCPACLRRDPVQCIAAFDYIWPGLWLIRAYKQQRRLELSRTLGALMAMAWRRQTVCAHEAVLVPVPASAQALRRRGFNCAAELAAVVAQCEGLPMMRQGLQRQRRRRAQTGRNRHDRWQGLRGLFKAHAALAGRQVLLIDDVVTTGATVQAAVQALRRAGANCVGVLAAARTPAPGLASD